MEQMRTITDGNTRAAVFTLVRPVPRVLRRTLLPLGMADRPLGRGVD